MVRMLLTGWHVLARHWPALMAIYLCGYTAYWLLIQVSAWLSIFSTVLMIMVLPLAVLAKLVSYVGMLLVVRDSLPALTALAPSKYTSAADQRTGFIEAIMTSVIPFFAFYTTAGYLNADLREVLATGSQAAFQRGIPIDQSGLEERISVPLIMLFVGCFLLKQAWNKLKDDLPTWTRVPAVYVDVVWVLLGFYVVWAWIKAIIAWLLSRAFLKPFEDFGTWLTVHVPAVSSTGEAITAAIGVAVSLMVTALAWVTIAGVVYGQAVSAEQPAFRVSRFQAITEGYGRLGKSAKRRVDDAVGLATNRLKPLWDAFVLMLRAGPALIGAYILLWNLWAFVDRWLQVASFHMFGPQQPEFWAVFSALIWAIAPVISEPIRLSIVSAAYDTTLVRLTHARKNTTKPEPIATA